jgi:hypothetical protein
MAHITIEYMIMVPVLILQIFLFPIVAGVIMDGYNDSRRTLELQETAGHLGSTIQQVYYTINHATMEGSLRFSLNIPQTIEQYPYTVTLQNVTDRDTSYAVMNITLSFISLEGSSSTLVTLGNNVEWQDNLSFNSNSPNLYLTANKTAENIVLSLGGT